MRVAIGIDVGGTKTLAGLVAEDGTVLAQVRRPTVRERYLETLAEVHLQSRFDLDVFVDNDLHVATLGELRFGVGPRPTGNC